MTSDPFADQTLLYMKDGKDYATKLDPEKIEEIVEQMSLHEEPDSVTVKSEPEAKPSQLDLTRSQIISLFQHPPAVERAISTVCHKPAHMKERIGEASNPGPDIVDP